MIEDLGIAGLCIIGVGLLCFMFGWCNKDALGGSDMGKGIGNMMVICGSLFVCVLLCIIGATLLIVDLATAS